MTPAAQSTNEIPTAVAGLQQAMVSGDTSALAGHLSASATLISPLTERFAFQGRDALVALLADAASVVEGMRYTETLVDGRRVVLRGEASVRGRRLEEVVLVSLDDDGLIEELTLFMRPFTSVALLLRALTPLVARREGGRAAAFGAARLGGSIAAGARLADAAGAGMMKNAPGAIAADRS